MKEVSIMGIDLAKNVFHICAMDRKGKKLCTKKISRSHLLAFMKEQERCLVGIESCGGASYWAREFQRLGYQVKMISPQFVTPYVKANKNDYQDAEAIAEAVSRPTMRFVAVKEVWQQDIQCLHRIRESMVTQRTAVCNQIRGLLNEYGIVVAQGVAKLKKQLPLILEDAANELTDMGRELFDQLFRDLKQLENKITDIDFKIKQISRATPACQRIEKIEGIGPITSTAIISSVGDPQVFKNGRHFAAWLGLVPRQHSTGGKPRLLGISKRGNPYLRRLLIHGARSVVKYVQNKKDSRSRWILKKRETRGFNKACVALANKNARIVWALLRYETEYRKAA